jgi:hypothetical protein
MEETTITNEDIAFWDKKLTVGKLRQYLSDSQIPDEMPVKIAVLKPSSVYPFSETLISASNVSKCEQDSELHMHMNWAEAF